MDQIDKQLLDILQADFPVERRPYGQLAVRLNCSQEQLMQRVQKLLDHGIIRNIGPVFDATRLGYVSALVGASVPEDKLQAFVASVNSLPGVSHNYGRDHEFNVWFTLTMVSMDDIERTVNTLREEHGIDSIFILPSQKTYKIRVHFDFSPTCQCNVQPMPEKTARDAISAGPLSEADKDLVRCLQRGLEVVPEPFGSIAQKLAVDTDEVLEKIRRWKQNGIIRRFGVRIRHHQAGFHHNAMVVFDIEPDLIDEAGERLSRYRQVSHCYRRKTHPAWRYNLYAMVHALSQESLEELIAGLVNDVRPRRYAVLKSVTEYKKKRVCYYTEQSG